MGSYWPFLAVVVVLVVVPGPDVALIIRNTALRGRRPGVATSLGVSVASAVQGLLVSVGVACVLVRAHPVFLTIKWLGVAYLAYLAIDALRQARRGEYRETAGARPRSTAAGFRQGLLCNATNPKILVFYLALLPQFVGADAPWWTWLLHAWTLPVIGLLWCLLLVGFVDRARGWLTRRRVRRALDVATGTVLLGFCVELATE